MQQHIIHKQKVHIRSNVSANSFSLQSRVSTMFKNNLSNELNDIFDKFSDEENIVRIDKLKIDIGVIDEKKFEESFTKNLIAQLTEILSNYRLNKNDGNVFEIKKTHSLTESIIYFLQNGYTTWHQNTKNISDWEDEILNSFSNEEWIMFANALRENIATNQIAIRRLSIQFSEAFLKQLFFHLYKEKIEDWSLLYDKFIQQIEFHFKKHELYLSKKESYQILWEVFILLTLKGISKNNFEEKFAEEIIILLQENYLINKKNNSSKNNNEANEISNDETLLQVAKQELLNKQKLINEHKQEVDELFLVNAGIVLLHPFLKDYFETLGLIKEKIFINKQAQLRAVLLLYYLATNEIEVDEFNLILPKLLCGVHFSEPIENYIELTEKEKEEAFDLLKAVTQHWKPLNRTSIEGLQTSFFQREGKLQQTENGWTLRVEQKTIDILLDKLPWGISFIKLPWMKKSLQVDWN